MTALIFYNSFCRDRTMFCPYKEIRATTRVAPTHSKSFFGVQTFRFAINNIKLKLYTPESSEVLYSSQFLPCYFHKKT